MVQIVGVVLQRFYNLRACEKFDKVRKRKKKEKYQKKIRDRERERANILIALQGQRELILAMDSKSGCERIEIIPVLTFSQNT